MISDLGILLDEKLNFKSHYDLLIFMRRDNEFDNISVVKTLNCVNMRSVLEFGSIDWMSYTTDYINKFSNKFESIQKNSRKTSFIHS
jgi:hypothetical protein